MNKPLANMATALLATETIGQESAAVDALLTELKIQGHITDKHVWYFEPECREHEVVHLQHDITDKWLTVDTKTGEVTFS